jgi:hypothetical protein
VIDKTDNRNKPPKHYQAVECEAVGQSVLERLLREFLDARIPEPIDNVREREAQERVDVAALLNDLRTAR